MAVPFATAICADKISVVAFRDFTVMTLIFKPV